MITAEQIKEVLGLQPLPREGGFYRETYRSEETIALGCLPQRYDRDKPFCTAIYYLLTPETCSRLHRLPTDEIFHFHLGGPVEMLQLHPDGRSDVLEIGPDIAAGQRLQVVVPRGSWQGCSLKAGGRVALMSVTAAPGFDSSDYEPGDADALIRAYPDRRDMIVALTSPHA